MSADISNIVEVFVAPGNTTLVVICSNARRFTLTEIIQNVVLSYRV